MPKIIDHYQSPTSKKFDSPTIINNQNKVNNKIKQFILNKCDCNNGVIHKNELNLSKER